MSNSTKSGDTFTFALKAVSGHTYVIEYTDTLLPPAWQVLTDFVGTASPQTFRDTAPGISRRFYQFHNL